MQKFRPFLQIPSAIRKKCKNKQSPKALKHI